eukprot:31271-Pelagococcus_subviridis.AAC.4
MSVICVCGFTVSATASRMRPKSRCAIEVKQPDARDGGFRVSKRAGRAAEGLHLDVHLRATLRRGRGAVVRRLEHAATAGSAHAAAGEAALLGTAGEASAGSPAASSSSSSSSSSSGSPAAAAAARPLALALLLLLRGHILLVVVIVVVVPVHVLLLPGLVPPADVVRAPSSIRDPRAVPRLPPFQLLALDRLLVRLQHDRLRVEIVPVQVVRVVGGRPVVVQLRGADPPAAAFRAAVTLNRLVAVPFKIVIKRQLLPRRDVRERVDADAQLAVDHPLLRLAVGLARVVQEATGVASLRRVDRLRGRQRHEVKVSTTLLVVPLLPRPVLVLVQHLADVLDHELPFRQRLAREQAVAFPSGALHVQLGVLRAIPYERLSGWS